MKIFSSLKREMFSVGLGNNTKARGFRFLDPLLLFFEKKSEKQLPK
jgi:hypothetical protein